MSQIIAGTYEINEEIGAGGGGIVYMGKHLRLDKQVILKADKRKLSARPEVLRREVDALKNLSHTYIPQVYDFIEENGTVYTVMDYIKGESLDKPLGRGEHFPQADVIGWACELLEALVYLHSRPPHGILHGDIKPSNIMLTPEHDIRLIDFNIALALGEEGAVRVGFSRGYASPEHYGVRYPLTDTHHSKQPTREKTDRVTEALPNAGAVNEPIPRLSGSTKRNDEIMLDVRSDVYSAGATIYHLLTGRIPDEDARKVTPIHKSECSPAVAAIVAKAMAPDPQQRYQTAAEMLAAFYGLHKNDPLTKRHKRREIAAALLITTAFAAGGCATFTGLKRMERQENAYALAGYSTNALRSGDVKGAIGFALQALPETRSIFDPPYTPQAQKALTDALGVYDLSEGFKSYLTLELISEPLKIRMSPSGTRLAAFSAYNTVVYDLVTGQQLVTLPMEQSALSDILFSNDDTLIYAGEGGIRAYDLAGGRELWTGQPATQLALSGDGSRVAAVYKDEDHAVVYNVADGSTFATVPFGGKKQNVNVQNNMADVDDNLFELNLDGTMLASSFSDGSLQVFETANPEAWFSLCEPSEYTHFEGGFYDRFFAYIMYGNNLRCTFNAADFQSSKMVGTFDMPTRCSVKTNSAGIYISNENLLIKLDPVTGEQTEVAYTDSDRITAFSVEDNYSMIATEKKHYSFFRRGAVLVDEGDNEGNCDYIQVKGQYAVIGSRDSATVRVFRLEDHADAQIFSYDPAYTHSEARLSMDRSTVMLFRYTDFRLYSIDGKLIAEVQIPDSDNVYDQQYRKDKQGSRLEVIYNNGKVLTYSAVDGSILSEEQKETPDPSLQEEFLTDKYRIVSPFHGAAQVYDRESGKFLSELQSDDYLAYVTQVGDKIITEYNSLHGEIHYGLILDENLQTVARLPYLCDITENSFIYDYPTGIMRQSRIYSIDELISMAKKEELK